MGVWSTLRIGIVPVEYKSQEEINLRINKILKMPEFYMLGNHKEFYYIPNSVTTRPRIEHLHYAFKLEGTNVDIVPKKGDHRKHFDDMVLAFVISKLISPKGRTYIDYTGEGNTKWGYAIEEGEVHTIQYIPFVGKESIVKWLQEGKNA